MVECARHVNLVRLPPPPPPPPLAVEPGGLEVGGALERGLSDGSLQQRALLHSLVQVLQGDYLARLSCHHVSAARRGGGVCSYLPPHTHTHTHTADLP